MKNTFKSALLILALVIGTTAYAQKMNQTGERPCKHQQFADNHRPGAKFFQSLTEEQKEAFKAIRMKSMKETKPIQDELRELRAHQQTLMTADQPNLDAIYKNIEKMSTLQTQLAKIRAKSRLDMQGQLTDEQKIQFQHMKEMRMHKSGNGFHAGRSLDDKI